MWGEKEKPFRYLKDSKIVSATQRRKALRYCVPESLK